jgi:hypothetical protein
MVWRAHDRSDRPSSIGSAATNAANNIINVNGDAISRPISPACAGDDSNLCP